ncbi:MAG: hypothetical protein AAFP76_14370, partial [Bacteroidota bacterium]
MNSAKKILVLVPDGVGIKNYMYARVFQNPDINITLFHNFDSDTIRHINREMTTHSNIEIPAYKESLREKFLRELINVSRLRYNHKRVNNPTILEFRKSGHKSIKLALFYRLINILSVGIRSYKTILWLEKKYDLAIRRNSFYTQLTEILTTESPDALFCTHQRALKAPTVFAAAKDLGIPTTTVIYSWDNIPKARLALRSDHYLVWSDYMKRELQLFYPEISSEQITTTGTPQFEFYKDPENLIDRATFFKKYELDTSRKLLCFSGDDELTSPYDPQYLEDVAEAITQAGKESEYQIVFRRCPVDVSGRYDGVVSKFPKLIVEIPPLWNFNSKIWSAVYPTYDDVKLLVSLAYYTDAVINVGSTMAFDFGMFQKPCFYINYDQPNSSKWTVDVIYRFQHF